MSKKTFIVGGETHNQNKGALREYLAGLDIEKKWRVSVEPYTKRRSQSQVGLYRIWCDEIADECGHDGEEIHEILKKKYCPMKVVTIGNEETEIQSTKYLTTQEMSRYMERVQAWAATTLNMTLSLREERGKK